jgi:hypothetical protein
MDYIVFFFFFSFLFFSLLLPSNLLLYSAISSPISAACHDEDTTESTSSTAFDTNNAVMSDIVYSHANTNGNSVYSEPSSNKSESPRKHDEDRGSPNFSHSLTSTQPLPIEMQPTPPPIITVDPPQTTPSDAIESGVMVSPPSLLLSSFP